MGSFVRLPSMSETEKILIIRFSSFGDVVQSLTLPSALANRFPRAQVHWLTRQDMAPLLTGHPCLQKIWSFDRKSGLRGLARLAWSLRREKYTRIYDAHNNLRSRLVSFILRPAGCFGVGPLFIRRSIRRWKRFLLFRFRINTFEQPFSGQRDLLEPLKAWQVSPIPPPPPQIFPSLESQKKAQELLTSENKNFLNAIALAPSAAFFLKRWPKEYWIDLIRQMPTEKFILLGGPEDAFITDIAAAAPERTLNLAGRCSLLVSSAVIMKCRLLIANDTGLLHVGEQLGKACMALMGPAPFGFPSRPSTLILERKLPCRPCSKHGQGPCINKNYHECLVDIKPQEVIGHIQKEGKSL